MPGEPRRPLVVRRGREELLRLLEHDTHDVRALDLEGFRAWLGRHLTRWKTDPVFAQRVRIRELRRAHPRLAELEARCAAARAADERSPHFTRLRELERELRGASMAVDGLTSAAADVAGERRAELQRKLNGFRSRLAALRAEEAELIRSSPERRALLDAAAELERLRRETGLEAEEARLDELQRGRGQGSGRSGAAFEDAAARAVLREVVPELERGGDGQVRVLRGVTLGAARTELDQLVVRSTDAHRPVEVLAVVEAKRNINDLAHGVRQRLENLAWLTGAAHVYDAADHRTRHFPTGHFDRPAIHDQDGERFVLAAESFAPLRSGLDGGLACEHLFLVTRPGPVWGMGAAALARVAHRVATDPRWDPRSEPYLARLHQWCCSLAHQVETPDVLRAYAATELRASRVLLLER